MDELLEVEAWLQMLDFSRWTDDDDEQMNWLNSRDAPAFDTEYMRVFNLVEAQETDTFWGDTEKEAKQRILKLAYFKAMGAAGTGELAAYVMDDFDLLARAARVGFSDFWLDKLRVEYEAGRFPRGAL